MCILMQSSCQRLWRQGWKRGRQACGTCGLQYDRSVVYIGASLLIPSTAVQDYLSGKKIRQDLVTMSTEDVENIAAETQLVYTHVAFKMVQATAVVAPPLSLARQL